MIRKVNVGCSLIITVAKIVTEINEWVTSITQSGYVYIDGR